ncbi:MAG: J domain-containing protein [Actinomycetota bacterium]|nr:J domain-containing protein [Actinomycetota bacterium]
MTKPELAPFEVLGVSPHASPGEVSAAYRVMAQIFHPDRYQDSPEEVRQTSESLMKALNEAYAAAQNGLLAARPVQQSPRVRRQAHPTRECQGRPGFGAVAWDVAVRERAAQAVKSEKDRQARERAAPQGNAVGRPRKPLQMSMLSGLGLARHTNNVSCAGCHSIQWLPPGWRDLLDDTAFYCSGCDRLIFTR